MSQHYYIRNGEGYVICYRLFIGLRVCAHDNWKSCGRIWTKFSGSKDRTNQLDFEHLSLMPWLRTTNFNLGNIHLENRKVFTIDHAPRRKRRDPRQGNFSPLNTRPYCSTQKTKYGKISHYVRSENFRGWPRRRTRHTRARGPIGPEKFVSLHVLALFGKITNLAEGNTWEIDCRAHLRGSDGIVFGMRCDECSGSLLIWFLLQNKRVEGHWHHLQTQK